MELRVRSLDEDELEDDDELFTRQSFAPMKRLLDTRDEEFLRARGGAEVAKQYVRDQREIYKGYLKELSYQVRRQRAFRKLAMSGARNWDIRADMRKTLICEAALLHLRWLGWKRFFGIRVDTAVIDKYLTVLIPEFSPFSAAT